MSVFTLMEYCNLLRKKIDKNSKKIKVFEKIIKKEVRKYEYDEKFK